MHQQFTVGVSVAHETESTLGNELYSYLTGFASGSTRAATVRLIPEYTYRSEQQFLNLRLTLLRAYLLDYPSGTPTAALPDPRYVVWIGQVHHLWELAPAPFELESRATVQHTDARIATCTCRKSAASIRYAASRRRSSLSPTW